MGQYNADSLADRSVLYKDLVKQMLQQGDLYNMQSNLFNQQAQMGGAANQGQLLNLNQQGLHFAMQLTNKIFHNQGLAGAYGNQMNQQFGLSDFNRQGMGQDINALGSIGALNQGQQQALLSADATSNAQTGAYEPYGRLSQYGNTLTGLAGGVWRDNSIKNKVRLVLSKQH